MITVLRLGHRVFRDQRVTTHCALVARAFGANKIIYSGERDKSLENSVKKVTKQWGGPFGIYYTGNYRKYIKRFRGIKVHLTVYGLPFQKNMTKLKKVKEIMLIVGGEKVPPDVYRMADFNLAVTQQPHSEVAALALFLHEYFQGKELNKDFKKAKLEVVPQQRGKMLKKL